MSLQIDDVMTWMRHLEDRPYLESQFLDVNMRLFRSSKGYRRIILEICKELRVLALSELEGYGWPFGISGANTGIPLNIIGRVLYRGTKRANCQIMINPCILGYSNARHLAQSNCGSIRLVKPLTIRRYDWVLVKWFDEEGLSHTATFTQSMGGDTIQHEVDHNRGVLITEREAVPGVS